MSVDEETKFLQSQLEGLESIFLELIPFGVPLKRRNIQDYYDSRFDWAAKPTFLVSKNELRRQFNTKANQVRNIVDGAETLGNVQNKFNLVYAAGSLPTERQSNLDDDITEFCAGLLEEEVVSDVLLDRIMAKKNISAAAARTLLAAVMLVNSTEITVDECVVPLQELLGRLIEFVRMGNFLTVGDPFLQEALVFAETWNAETPPVN
jgi:hypothetical protein